MIRNLLIILALVSLALGGCGNGHDEEGGHGEHGEHGAGPAVEVPDHYAHAVEKLEELSTKIDGLIADGHLEDVHRTAADIKKIAEKLPALAKTDLPAGMLKDVNVTAKQLAGTFSEIDEAADAGKKDETVAVHDRMKALIADLKKHAAHEEEEGHEDE
ncbi:MAG: hypothetical protein O7F08_14255 [Deltaproteobacteria bacterium]|nr:hypothetical protein [Deltaproteobacteria bacterium]